MNFLSLCLIPDHMAELLCVVILPKPFHEHLFLLYRLLLVECGETLGLGVEELLARHVFGKFGAGILTSLNARHSPIESSNSLCIKSVRKHFSYLCGWEIQPILDL